MEIEDNFEEEEKEDSHTKKAIDQCESAIRNAEGVIETEKVIKYLILISVVCQTTTARYFRTSHLNGNSSSWM